MRSVMPVGLVSHSGSLERDMGYTAPGLVELEVDLDVQIDSDGHAMLIVAGANLNCFTVSIAAWSSVSAASR